VHLGIGKKYMTSMDFPPPELVDYGKNKKGNENVQPLLIIPDFGIR
jgi:hypothetical protein